MSKPCIGLKNNEQMYKAGDKVIYGSIELIVQRGKCDDCFFSRVADTGDPYCEAIFQHGCPSTIAIDCCFKLLNNGL